jgi:hypothetical protein
MLTKIIDTVKSWLAHSSYSSELERFITSSNPQNNAQVEALEREYNLRRSSQNYIWGKGI